MEVVVSHTAKDHQNAVRHLTKRMLSGGPGRFLLGVLNALPAFFLAMGAMLLAQFLERYPGRYRDFIEYALGSVILAFVCAIAARHAYQALCTRRLSRPGGYGLSPQRFSIEEDGLEVSTRNSRSRFGWSDMEGVEATQDYLYAYLDRGMAVFIARRGFVDEASFEAFRAALEARVAAAKHSAAATS